jgi:hypothetical protein
VQVRKVDPSRRRDLRRFVGLPFRLYSASPEWCPPLRADVARALDRDRHPFYRHSEAESFLAEEGGRAVGRITVMENRNFNRARDRRDAFFYFYESENDQEAATGLVAAAADWARARGLDTLIGPKGFLPGDPMGVLVEGFEHRAPMGVPYHHPYYQPLLAAAGLEKETDYLSARLTRDNLLPAEFLEAADAAAAAQGYRLQPFTSKRQLHRWFPRIGAAYNRSFIDTWEYCPLTPEEIDQIGDRLLTLADPHFMVLAMKGDEVAGFLIIIPDLAEGLRRTHGRLLPFGWARLLLEARRTQAVELLAMGLVPEHQGLGANAVIYAALFRAVGDYPRFHHAEVVQIEEGNLRMVRNMTAIGFPWRQRHRIYRLPL